MKYPNTQIPKEIPSTKHQRSFKIQSSKVLGYLGGWVLGYLKTESPVRRAFWRALRQRLSERRTHLLSGFPAPPENGDGPHSGFGYTTYNQLLYQLATNQLTN
jgi:hypothetical protein